MGYNLENLGILEDALVRIFKHGGEYFLTSGQQEVIEQFRAMGVVEEIDVTGLSVEEVLEAIVKKIK